MKPIHLREEKISWADCSEISVINAINRPDEAVLVRFILLSVISLINFIIQKKNR